MEIINKYSYLTEQAAGDKPDIIIWPETAYPYLVDFPEGASEITVLAKKIDIPILAGLVYEENGSFYNSAVLFSGKGDFAGKYYKTHLVPFGEYIPLKKYFNVLKRYIDKPIGDYGKGNELTIFPMVSVKNFVSSTGESVRATNFYKFGVLICFEDIFPYLSRELKNKGADFLVNITNDAWFGKSAAAAQHVQASVFRAVENSLPVIRAANTGISCFIDSMGNIYSMASLADENTFVDAFKTANVPIKKRQTLYSLNGDIIIVIGAWFVIFSVILHTLRRGIWPK